MVNLACHSPVISWNLGRLVPHKNILVMIYIRTDEENALNNQQEQYFMRCFAALRFCIEEVIKCYI